MAGVAEALTSFQKEVESVQKTLSGLKAIEDQLNHPRSVVCMLLNVTDVPLSYGGRNLDHGEITTLEPPSIAPRTADAFSAESASGGILVGTEGTVWYNTPDGSSFRFHWANPWVGGTRSESDGSGPVANALYNTWTETGSGDQRAPIRFIVQQKMPTPFHDIWVRLGGITGILGLPTSDLVGTPDGIGAFMHFERGSIYDSPGNGVHEVHGAIRNKWSSLGWETSFLGYPVTDEVTPPDRVGRFNHFQHGSIYWSPDTGAHEVHGAIRDKWSSLGWETGVLGYPTTDESKPPDQVGRFNHFQHGSIYWSPATGAHEVHGAIRDKWAAMGWEKSFLGYPVSDEEDMPGGRVSRFQGGRIEWNRATGAVTVVNTAILKHVTDPR